MERYYKSDPVPRAFFWRRMQSLMGLFLVLFLLEHLLTNSQASLTYGSDGVGFIHAVNGIHNLPYLPAIEIMLIAIPFLIHMVWGVKYLMTSAQNSYGGSEAEPKLDNYLRNHAYTWQRITSWLLLVAVIAHVADMRFINYPTSAKIGAKSYYMMGVSLDEGLYTLAERLDVKLIGEKELLEAKKRAEGEESAPPIASAEALSGFFRAIKGLFGDSEGEGLEGGEVDKLLAEQSKEQRREWIEAVEAWPLGGSAAVAVAPDFGTAELLLIRETFKSPLMLFLYSLFVLAATYHAFNGLFTFNITWGIALTARAQQLVRLITLLLMFTVGFLGLAAVWGSYLVNLHS